MPDRSQLRQTAPWPGDLEVLVAQCNYRKHEGWRVQLDPDQQRDEVDGKVVGSGTTLVITTCGYDTYNPDRGPNYRVQHYFIVPAATYNKDAWCRWLFDQFAKVELHECMENFVISGDYCTCGAVAWPSESGEPQPKSEHAASCNLHGERPFAPLHGPGCDPYTVHQYATDEQKRTRFTGEVLPS